MLFGKSGSDEKSTLEALNSSLAIIEFSPQGDILRANDNFLNVMGYRASELIGAHHRQFCEPGYAGSEAYRRFWADLGRGQYQSDQFKRFTKTGEAIWLQATYNPIRDRAGKVVKVIKFASDITAAKLKEIDEAGKITAIDRAQAVIEFTPEGTILTANANFLGAVGYELSEIRGKHHSLFCEPSLVQSPEYRQFWTSLSQGQYQAAEYKRIGKGGRIVYIQASYNPIFDDAGKVVKVVKYATDMTEAVLKRIRNDKLSKEIDADLGDTIRQMQLATEMASSASTASTETGSVVTSVAAASEELSQSVKDIAQNMEQAQGEVESVFRHAESANSAASSLNDSAASMNNVVTLIQDIASQINLLALNATIESARAGEAGRGFAVVASEVKSLANQAARSTEMIAAEINTMQSVTNEVVSSLSLISNSMTSVMENVSSVAGAIEQQSAVTHEISNNMQSAVSAVNEIEESLGKISATFSAVSDASEQVKKNVETLAA
jgi:methyl-accepting chemotaxis protein